MQARADRVDRTARTGKHPSAMRSGVRGQSASAAIGPLGYIFKSASTARVLTFFSRTPGKPHGLGELLASIGASKGALQQALRTLEKARIIHREGAGPKTAYRYDIDSEVGKAVLAAVEASRKLVDEPQSAIPWLSRFTVPERRPIKLHAGRIEPEVSEEAADRVLRASERTEDYGQKRSRPGLKTRG